MCFGMQEMPDQVSLTKVLQTDRRLPYTVESCKVWTYLIEAHQIYTRCSLIIMLLMGQSALLSSDLLQDTNFCPVQVHRYTKCHFFSNFTMVTK